MKSITIGNWVGILQVAIGALGLLSQFLQANVFQPYAIATLVAGVLTLVLTYITSNEAVKLGLKK